MGGRISVSNQTNARAIVFAGLVAAAYAVATLALAPISYGPLQFRVAGLLKPLALLNRMMALGLAVGVLLANLTSPFGAWDYMVMPVVSWLAAIICWQLRQWPIPALLVQAAIIAVGVAVFPLHLGANIPIWPTVAMVFVSEAILYVTGWLVIWHADPTNRGMG